MKKEKTRILVTGGTGFIGYHLVKKCIKIGWQVTSISKKHPTKKKFVKGVNYKFIDLKKTKEVNLINKNYDYVVNLSGYINNNIKKKYTNDHYLILKNLVNHFKNTKIKSFLQIGTSAEYGGRNSPQDETSNVPPSLNMAKIS